MGKRATNSIMDFPNLLPFEGGLALPQILTEMGLQWRGTSYMQDGPFGPVKVDFRNIPVNFSNGDSYNIPWGEYMIPELGNIRTLVGTDDDMPVFRLVAVEVDDQEKWAELVEKLKLVQSPLYKGRALRMKFSPFGGVSAPEELKLSSPGTPIFNDAVADAIEASVFFPIENTQLVREMGIPLKRGVCLEGPYGMGKTLTANMTAHKAIQNGWTFILVPFAGAVADSFKFAKRLSPAVVFVEDIDEFLKNDREEINEFLNVLDGIDSKTEEVLTVFSTNYVGDLDRAFLRPGRVDALIELEAPNAATAKKLIAHYSGGIHSQEAADMLAGASPAIIRECVERAKLLSLKHKRPIDTALLVECAKQMTRQRELMMPNPQKDRSFEKVHQKFFIDALNEWQRGAY